MLITDRKFVCYFHFYSFSTFSLGVSLDVKQPNIEIHVPFGFFRIGLAGVVHNLPAFKKHTYGIGI